MRKISLFLLIFGLIAVGCDSNDDDPSDAELFVGDWALSSLTDAEGAVALELYTAVSVSFDSDDSFSLDLEGGEGVPDLAISGNFVVTEADGEIRLNAVIPNVGSIPLTFTYEFDGDDSVDLIAGPQTTAALNSVLGLELTSPVTFSVTRI